MSRQTALGAGPGGWAVRALTKNEEHSFAVNEEAFRRAREAEEQEAEQRVEQLTDEEGGCAFFELSLRTRCH